jgi:hypothetical protein
VLNRQIFKWQREICFSTSAQYETRLEEDNGTSVSILAFVNAKLNWKGKKLANLVIKFGIDARCPVPGSNLSCQSVLSRFLAWLCVFVLSPVYFLPLMIYVERTSS